MRKRTQPHPRKDTPSHPRKNAQLHPSLRHPHLGYWPLLWVIIYALILVVNLFQQTGTLITVIKLGGVLLCSIYSIQRFPKDYLLQLAMMTTFIADCFLACDNISIIGLMVFFIAQVLHLYRLTSSKHHPHVFTFAVAALFVMACANLVNLIPPIYVVITFYVCALGSNILLAYFWQKSQPQNFQAKAAFAGFILFACCDLCTGISYLSLIHVLPAFVYAPANFTAWLFYYPSQIFVSNSSKCATIVSKEGKC